jgi:hypothetical protein
VLLAATLVLGAAAPFTRWDADPELLTLDGSPELRTYREYLRRFGSDELIVIALRMEGLLEPAGLARVRSLGEALSEIEGVADVASLDTAWRVDYGPFGPFARPVVPDALEEAPPPEALRATLRELPMTRDTLLDASGTVTAITVKPEGRSLGAEARGVQRRVLDGVDAVLARPEYRDVEFHVAGAPVFNRELERMNTRDNHLFTPIVVAILAVQIGVALRSLPALGLVLACMLGSLAWVRGAMTLLGVPLNTTTSLLAPVVLTLSTSVALHLLARYQRERAAGQGALAAIASAEQAVLLPALLCALTTAIGFASLLASPIPSIRSFGVFSAVGVLASFLLGGVALPAALRLLRLEAPPGRASRATDDLLRRVVGFGERRGGAVLLAAGALALVSAAALPSLRVATHDGEFFAENHPLNRSYRFIESRLAGVTPLEVVVEASSPGGVRTAEGVAALAAIQDFLGAQPETVRGVSLADWMDEARRALEPGSGPLPPLDAEGARRAAFVLEAVARQDLPYWVQEDGRVARVSSRSVGLDSARNDALLRRVETFLREDWRGGGLHASVTGLVPVFARMEEALLESQVKSFGSAFLAIFGVFLVLFRSPLLAALAMAPNVLPILATLGLMAVLGVPLDVVTVMVASINLGIVVDDTTHLLHGFRERMGRGESADDAIASTLAATGRAIVFSSVMLSLGFGVLALSDFRPTARFGGLTAFTLGLALFMDLLLTPTLVRWARPSLVTREVVAA